jgi:hypothetical protein
MRGPDSAKGGVEHRKHPRIPADRAVRAVQRNHAFTGRLKDISRGGAAVQTDASLDDESLVELHFDDMAKVTGQFVRPLDDGFALAFEADDEDTVLDDILRGHGRGTEDY